MNDAQKTIAGALLIGGSLALGNPALITAAGGIGVNWTSEGLQGVLRAWHNRKLDSPLARAYSAAITNAVQRLRADYKDREDSRAELQAFDLVAACADGIANAEFSPQRMDADAAQAQLAHGLDDLLHGFDARQAQYLQKRLMSATALALRDALAADDEAWKRFHGWLIEDLHEKQTALTLKMDHFNDVLDTFAATPPPVPQPSAIGAYFDNRGMVVHGNSYHSEGDMYVGSTHVEVKDGGTVNVNPVGVDTSTPSAKKPGTPIDQTAFRDWLNKHYDKPELELLCANVQTNLARDGHVITASLEDVPTGGKLVVCQRLIGHLDRRGLLQYLVDEARRLRPGVAWIS